MKKLFCVVGCWVLLSGSPAWAAEDPAVVIVRVSERAGRVMLAISKGTGAAEILEFDNGDNEKYLTRAADGYQKAIAQLYSQGYVLQGTVHGKQEDTKSYSTLIFVKAPKS